LGKEGIDCRKCLSYLTIESREPIPQNCREYVSRDIFGCDRCVDACPYNQQPEASPDIKPLIKAGYKKNEILELNEERFNERFGRTPVTRAGLEKLKSHINN
jgi:epoxyqueuosine reductase